MEMNIDFNDNNPEGISEKNISRVISLCTAFDLYIKLIMITKLYLFCLDGEKKYMNYLFSKSQHPLYKEKMNRTG